MEKNIKNFQVVEINEKKSGSNKNNFTGEDEEYITCSMEEIPMAGQPYSGAEIGYTFQQRTEGGWIRKLNQLREEKITVDKLPPFGGFIHEQETPPFMRLIKDAQGNLNPLTYEEGDNKGLPVIFNRYRMLLKAGTDPKLAVQDYLDSNRVKLVTAAIAEGTNIPDYKAGSKAATILDMNKLQDAESTSEKVGG